MMEADQSKTQLTIVAPSKPQRQHVHSTLPKNIGQVRGKYFRTNFSADLQYASIDGNYLDTVQRTLTRVFSSSSE